PLFLRNVAYTLGHITEGTGEETLRPGQVKTLRPDTAVAQVDVTDPAGQVRSLRRGTRAEFAYGDTERVGVYRIAWAGGLRRGVLESKEPGRRAFADYRRFIQHHYDGLPGKLTAVTGLLTGHEALAGRLLSPAGFDVRGCKRILDAGCGNGRYSKFLLREADPDAFLAGFDLSQRMLKRARRRLQSQRIRHVAADLTKIPFASGSFDAVVCGYVLEHLPD